MVSSMVSSSAFPPGMSAVSMRRRCDTTSSLLEFSDSLEIEDMEMVRALHAEWFPLSYDEDFYAKVERGEVSAVVARNEKNELVGLAIYRIRPVTDLPGSEDFVHLQSVQAAYLMTLGVVEEWRGRGVGSSLLEKLITQLHPPQERVHRMSPWLLYLHVIEYNEPAMALYNKAGFEQVSRKCDFYFIRDRYYAAITLAHFFHKDVIKTPGRKIGGLWDSVCLGFL